MRRVIGAQTVRRFRRPRCLKGQRHVWVLGAATIASPTGQLSGPGGAHLRGTCDNCRKARTFHPNAAIRPAMAAA